MEFTFFRDELGTIWYRDCFSVEAESYEEACEKAIEMAKNNDIIEVDYSEPLYDTFTPIISDIFTSTVELSDEYDVILYTNNEK